MDAVVLQALAEAAKYFYSKNFNLDIFLLDEAKKPFMIRINDSNQLNLVSTIITSNPSSIAIMANGTGIAVLEVSWKFNLKTNKIANNFDIKVELDTRSSINGIILKACTSFIPDVNQTESELAVMEIAMPSGFEFNKISLGRENLRVGKTMKI